MKHKEPWEDACPWREGLICREEKPHCARCGWNPEEEKRRKAARRGENTDCHTSLRAGSQ